MRKFPMLCYTAILAILIISCSKSFDQTNETPLAEDQALRQDDIVTLGEVPCDSYRPLSWESTDVLKGDWQGITIRVTSPTYRVYCDNGGTVVLSNGLPFWGSLGLDYAQNVQVMEYPSSSSNQFLIVQGTLANPNISAYNEGLRKFRTAWNAFLDTPSKAMPIIDDYIPKGGTSGVRNITGKLIRVTSGSKFAVAPTCHPHKLGCTNTPLNSKGWFYYIYDGDIAKKVWVIVDPNNPSVIVSGKIDGNPTIYTASGTFISSPRSVSNFSMNSPIGLITYTGTLNYP